MALTDNIVSYWKLDESSGNAADSVGSNTLANTGVSYSAGLINNAADFDTGGSDVLTITDAAQTGLDFGSTDFSISFWFDSSENNPAANRCLISKSDTGGATIGVQAFLLTTGKVEVGIKDGTDSVYVQSTTDIADGAYHHIVMVRDNTANLLRLYVGGSANATGDSSAIGSVDSTDNFNVGNRDAGEGYGGQIDEIGVWSRALTSTEVSQLYNSGAGLQYPFGGATATNNFLLMGV